MDPERIHEKLRGYPAMYYARCAWTLFGLPSLALLTMQFDDQDWFFIAEDGVKLFQNSLAREMKQLVKETEPFTETAWNAGCFAYQLAFRSLPRRPKDFTPWT